MGEKVIILSLASDLKRITQSIQGNSPVAVKRFNLEAQKWLKLATKIDDGGISKMLGKIEKVLGQKNDLVKAEDCLMYSALLQNRANFLK